MEYEDRARQLLSRALVTVLLAAPLALPLSSAGQTADRVWRDADEEQVARPRGPADWLAEPPPSPPTGAERGLEEGPWPPEDTARLKADRWLAAPAIDSLSPSLIGSAGPRPAIVSRIPGLSRTESGGFFPPDTSIGIGPERLVQTVNTYARIFDRDGATLDSARLQEWFGVASVASVTDPKVHWDPFSERFVAVMLELDFDRTEAWLNVALSRDATPDALAPADWCTYRVSTVHADSWGDYPGLGLNDRWIAVSTNNFGFNSGFVESRMFVFDKTVVKGTLASCPELPTFTFNLLEDSSGETVFNPQPAQHYDPSATSASTLFAVGSVFGVGNSYTLWRIEAKGGKPRLTDEIVSSSQYVIPPNAEQPGGLELDSGDNRAMQQASYRNGQLWLAHSTRCVPKGSTDFFSCIRVAQMRPGDRRGDAEVDFEATLGKKNEYFFWPGVVVTEDGDVVVAALRSGANRFLETVTFGMRKGAARFTEPFAPARFGGPRPTEPGDCTPINVSRNSFGVAIARSGDYVGLALDPDSPDIWISGEHGEIVPPVGGCIWSTALVRVRF